MRSPAHALSVVAYSVVPNESTLPSEGVNGKHGGMGFAVSFGANAQPFGLATHPMRKHTVALGKNDFLPSHNVGQRALVSLAALSVLKFAQLGRNSR